MTKKKKKALTLRQMMLRDAGKGLENFNPKPVKVNVFDKARSIKTWDQLRYILEEYAPAVAYPSSAAQIILNHVREHWDFYKIFKDPDNYGAIVQLVKFADRVTNKRAYKSQLLKVFCKWTGFRKPQTLDTFKNDMTKFRDFLGKKTHYNPRLKESAADIAYEKEMQKKLADPEWTKKFFKFGNKSLDK